MTVIQFCKNCKHLGLDGMFGLICDVNGNNKNHDCPKYEEKGVERMTEKNSYHMVSKYLCHSRRTDKKVMNEFRFDCKNIERVGMSRYLIIR